MLSKRDDQLENFKSVYLEMLDHCKFSILTLEDKRSLLQNECQSIKRLQTTQTIDYEGSYLLLNILELFNVKSILTSDKMELAVKAEIGHKSPYKTHFSFVDKGGRMLWNETLQIEA